MGCCLIVVVFRGNFDEDFTMYEVSYVAVRVCVPMHVHQEKISNTPVLQKLQHDGWLFHTTTIHSTYNRKSV